MTKSRLLKVLFIVLLSLNVVNAFADYYTYEQYSHAKSMALAMCPAQHFSTLGDQLNCINQLLKSWGFAEVSSVPQ